MFDRHSLLSIMSNWVRTAHTRHTRRHTIMRVLDDLSMDMYACLSGSDAAVVVVHKTRVYSRYSRIQSLTL